MCVLLFSEDYDSVELAEIAPGKDKAAAEATRLADRSASHHAASVRDTKQKQNAESRKAWPLALPQPD